MAKRQPTLDEVSKGGQYLCQNARDPKRWETCFYYRQEWRSCRHAGRIDPTDWFVSFNLDDRKPVEPIEHVECPDLGPMGEYFEWRGEYRKARQGEVLCGLDRYLSIWNAPFPSEWSYYILHFKHPQPTEQPERPFPPEALAKLPEDYEAVRWATEEDKGRGNSHLYHVDRCGIWAFCPMNTSVVGDTRREIICRKKGQDSDEQDRMDKPKLRRPEVPLRRGR